MLISRFALFCGFLICFICEVNLAGENSIQDIFSAFGSALACRINLCRRIIALRHAHVGTVYLMWINADFTVSERLYGLKMSDFSIFSDLAGKTAL